MGFLSPIWLLGLVPWAVLALWMLIGRPPRIPVPFLRLWEGPVAVPRSRRSLRVWPLAVALALGALLLALLAAARPYWAGRGTAGEPVASVIVDRGMSMSARSGDVLRFQQTFESAVPELQRRFGPRAIRVVSVPGEGSVVGSVRECADAVRQWTPTAVQTDAMLDEAIASEGTRSRAVLVITDRPIARGHSNVVRIAPAGSVQDVGVVTLAARKDPAAQVMVRVRNQSSRTTATLVIESEGATASKQIDLPADGKDGDYFVDLPRLGATVSCRLDVSDDLPADDRAWLVREGSSPKVEPHASLSAELARVAEVYQRSRPARDASSRLMLVRETAQLPARERGVIAAAGNETIAPKPVRVQPHRVTAHVNWDALPGPLRIAGDPPAGWSPLVSVAGRVLVAARPEEPRQVWVGFDAPEWARTTDFVIFWTNVFDWAGGGGASFVAHPLSEWSPEWTPVEPIPAPAGMWPGLYRRSDGALRAFAAPGVKMSSPVRTDWASRLSAVPVTVGRLDLSGVLLALAVGCVALSAGVWRRARQAARIPEIDTGGRSRASA